MNVNGLVKIFKLEPQNNGKLVGKANDKLRELATKGIVEKLKINVTSGKLRNRSYQAKDGQFRTWLEITVFDFELPESKQEPKGFGFTGNKFSSSHLTIQIYRFKI